MNAIVITFDRLPARFLGCYGNEWIDTPNFDRLASQCAVFDQHFAENLATASSSHAWWSGRYECRRNGAPADHPLRLLIDRGITVRMLYETAGDRDAMTIAGLPSECLESIPGVDGLDVSEHDTPFFRLVARAQRDLRLLKTSRSEPWLLWIKSRGVPIPWLAPREFAAKFLEVDDELSANGDDENESDDDDALVEMSPAEFDNLLSSLAMLPENRQNQRSLTAVERGLIRKVFGGYVALLDAGLGQFLEPIEQAVAASPTLLILAAAEGVPVRQPGALLDDWQRFGEEVVHTPLFIRPGESKRGARRQTLVQPVDLLPTLAEWFGVDGSGAALEGRSLLPAAHGEAGDGARSAFCADGSGKRGIRTSDFYFVADNSLSDRSDDNQDDRDGPKHHRLFVKPEDIWETNELSAQFPDTVEDLSSKLDQFFTGQ